ncbi:hypothetical protein ACHAP8_011263 [Fusarium lateritium]
MTIVRALLRRGFSDKIHRHKLSDGFELDAFAIALGNLEWGSGSQGYHFDFGLSKAGAWGITRSMKDRSTHLPLNQEFLGQDYPETPRKNNSENQDQQSEDSLEPSPDIRIARGKNNAQEIMDLRRFLAQLADWKSPVTSEAARLAAAIEATMNVLHSTAKATSFTWSLQVNLSDEPGELTAGTVKLHLEYKEEQWKSHVDELESVLSLWLYSTTKKMETSKARLGVKGNPLKAEDDTWIRGEKSLAEGGLIMLGQRTEELSWALRWWLPPDAPMPLEIDEEEEATFGKYKEWQVVGIGQIGQGFKGSVANNLTSTQPSDSQTSLNREETQSKKHGKRPLSSAIQSHDSLERLYAKHIFHTFIWDAVAALNKPTWQDLGIESFGTLDSKQDSNNFHLQCTRLSELAKTIQSTGFGDLPDAYSALIPPLEAQLQLGTLDFIIDMVSIEATEHQRVPDLKKAGDEIGCNDS